MNLEELKKQWQEQEQSLQEMHQVNAQLLRSMIRQRSTDAIGQMLNAEYLSTAVCALLLLVLFCSVPFFTGMTGLMVAFVISVLLTGAGFAWNLYKIRFLQQLSFGNTPVADMAEKLERFRLMMIREKMTGFILGPVIMGALLPLAHKLVNGDNPFLYLKMYGIRLALGYEAFIVLTILGYQKFYFRNIRSILEHLQEIRAFKV